MGRSGKSRFNTAFTGRRSAGQKGGVWEMQNHQPGSQADWAILRKELPSTSPGMNSEIPPTNSPPPPHEGEEPSLASNAPLRNGCG